MARIRTIKPDFFRHKELYDAEKKCRLPLRIAFAGLFGCADRDGKFKWQPETLKLDCLPHDKVNFANVLQRLCEFGFLVKYEVAGKEYGIIPTFLVHQKIRSDEAKSTIPDPPTDTNPNEPVTNPSEPVTNPLEPESWKGRERKGIGKEGKGTPPAQEEPIEPESKEKKEIPPVAADPPLKRVGEDVPYENDIAMREVSVCYDVYLSPAYQRTRDDICMMRNMDQQKLKDWVEAFNRYLISDSCRGKTMADYASHLSRWMNIQIGKGITEPKTLYSNGQSTTSTQREVQSSLDKIDRMYGSAK